MVTSIPNPRWIFGLLAMMLVIAAACSSADPATEAMSSPEEVGAAMVTATDGHDADAAIALLGADPTIRVFSARTPDEYGAIFGWFEAVDWRFENQGCSSSTTGDVTCQVRQSNEWSEALDVEPVAAEFRLTVAEGQVTSLEYEFDLSRWSGAVFQPFFTYVAAVHPDKLEMMWNRTDEGIAGPKLSEEAFILFDQVSAEYTESAANAG